MRRLKVGALCFALLVGAPGRAASLDEAFSALMNGQPEVTVKLLRESRDAPSLALLARAYVGQSAFARSVADKKKLYAASETAARAAVAADTHSAEALVELAVALALQLQDVGLAQATRTGLEIRRLYERAVQLDPGMARAWMGLGTWHGQVLALGAVVAFAAGGSEATMRADYRKAISLQPNEMFFRLSYADSLLLLAQHDARRAAVLKAEAQGLLEQALTLTPQNYWQRYDQMQVRERLSRLVAGMNARER